MQKLLDVYANLLLLSEFIIQENMSASLTPGVAVPETKVTELIRIKAFGAV